MTSENTPSAAASTSNRPQVRYPWGWWITSLLIILVAFLWRVRSTGQLWGAPWDLLTSEGAMHPAGLLVNWLAGAVSVGVGRHTVKAARACQAKRHQLTWIGLAFVLMGIVPFLGMRSTYSPHFTKDVTTASMPVIAALEAYHTDHGEYPPSLEHVVPEYLPSVPSLGYGGRRELHYYRAGSAPMPDDDRRKPDHLWETWIGEAPYALVVERVPGGTMVYRPTGEYGDLPRGHGLAGTDWGATSID